VKKIDIFPHIFPKAYFDKMVEVIPPRPPSDAGRKSRAVRSECAAEDDGGVRSGLSADPDSLHAGDRICGAAGNSPELARIANDGMAEIVAKYPQRFPAFAASVPMNNVKAAIAEITRAVEKLDARGIQIMTNVNGRPLDDPELSPIFELMHSYDLPIWMHPTRPQKFADYPVESGSKYDIWWCFGWPMRRARRWRGWCSPASSTAGRI
jgi:hypothetical protein